MKNDNILYLQSFSKVPNNYNGWVSWDGLAYKHCVRYYVNGKNHREDGPACLWFSVSNKVIIKEYWLNDNNYTFAQFYEKQKHTIHAAKIMAEVLGEKDDDTQSKLFV